MSGILRALHVSTHLLSPVILGGRSSHYSHFTDGEAEAGRGRLALGYPGSACESLACPREGPGGRRAFGGPAGGRRRWSSQPRNAGQMGLQEERAGLPTPGPECLNGPGMGGGGWHSGGEALGPQGAPGFTAMNPVPAIVLWTPRARRVPSGWSRKREPRGRQGLEVQRRKRTHFSVSRG